MRWLARRPAVLAVGVRLDAAAGDAVLAALRALPAGPPGPTGDRGRDLVLDCRGLGSPEPEGVRPLARAVEVAHDAGGCCYLVGPPPGLRAQVATASGVLPLVLPDPPVVAREPVLAVLRRTPLGRERPLPTAWAGWAPDAVPMLAARGTARYRGADATAWGPVDGVPDLPSLVEVAHGERDRLVPMLRAAGAEVTPGTLLAVARIAAWVDACRRCGVAHQRTLADLAALVGSRSAPSSWTGSPRARPMVTLP